MISPINSSTSSLLTLLLLNQALDVIKLSVSIPRKHQTPFPLYRSLLGLQNRHMGLKSVASIERISLQRDFQYCFFHLLRTSLQRSKSSLQRSGYFSLQIDLSSRYIEVGSLCNDISRISFSLISLQRDFISVQRNFQNLS